MLSNYSWVQISLVKTYCFITNIRLNLFNLTNNTHLCANSPVLGNICKDKLTQTTTN